MSQTDIVQELDNAFNHVAVCHCGNGYLDGSCDNHDFRWNPCDDSMMLANARMEIIRLRCKLGLPAIPSLVEPGPITQLRERLDAVEKERDKALRYGAPENATALSHVKNPCTKHNQYWTTHYGSCMACRANDAEDESKKLRLSNERMREALLWLNENLGIQPMTECMMVLSAALTAESGTEGKAISPTRKCSTCMKVGTMTHSTANHKFTGLLRNCASWDVECRDMPCLRCSCCGAISLTDKSFAAIDIELDRVAGPIHPTHPKGE